MFNLPNNIKPFYGTRINADFQTRINADDIRGHPRFRFQTESANIRVQPVKNLFFKLLNNIKPFYGTRINADFQTRINAYPLRFILRTLSPGCQ